MHQDSPHVFLRSLNWLLYDGQEDHPLSCFAGIINPQTGELRYAMAGKTGAYVIGQRGEERRLGTPEPTPALGASRSTVYPLLSEQIEPKETIVLFTPGVTTAKNRQEETFGEGRFVNILCDGFGQLASAMLKEMLSDLRNFTAGGSQPDDITVLLAHRVDI
jgi:phosphoserine phosphatase RsbU/P